MRLREQILALIEPRAQLQHLRHERIIRDDENAVMSIKKMTKYINTLGVEYAKNLPTVTHDCLAFEREMRSYLRGDTDDAPSAPILYMEAFPNLEEFLGEQFKYSQFQEGYDQAKSWIEERLSRRLAS